MKENKIEAENLFAFAMAKRPPEELFDIVNDPACQYNLINDESFAFDKIRLSEVLNSYLLKTKDPRVVTGESPWDDYPYYYENPKGVRPYHTLRDD